MVYREHAIAADVAVDAALFMGRSFRVGVGAGGSVGALWVYRRGTGGGGGSEDEDTEQGPKAYRRESGFRELRIMRRCTVLREIQCPTGTGSASVQPLLLHLSMSQLAPAGAEAQGDGDGDGEGGGARGPREFSSARGTKSSHPCARSMLALLAWQLRRQCQGGRGRGGGDSRDGERLSQMWR